MATKYTIGLNELESKIGGVAVHAKVHSLSAWFVLALRLIEDQGGNPRC